jgi:hypothetical protein
MVLDVDDSAKDATLEGGEKIVEKKDHDNDGVDVKKEDDVKGDDVKADDKVEKTRCTLKEGGSGVWMCMTCA